MASYTAYMDTSGDQSRTAHGTALVTVGILGSAAQWSKLDERWRAVLAAYGLEYLHMRTLGRQFRDNPDGRERLLLDAVRVLRKYSAQTFVTSLIPYEYDLVNAEFNLDGVFQSKFGCVAGSSAMFVREWFAHNSSSAQRHSLDVVHESGDTGKGAALVVAARHGYSFRLAPATTSGPAKSAFQAADFVAWEIRRVLEDFLHQNSAPTTKVVLDISYRLTKQVHMWSRESLEEMCVKNRITRRS